MDRTTNSLLNVAVFFALGYAVARGLRDHATGLRAGAVAGVLGGVISWIGYERPEVLEPEEDEAEPIEIEV